MKKTLNFINKEFLIDKFISKDLINNHPKFNHFINLAKEMSLLSTFERNQLGAIIVLKGKVVARGYNQSKSHTIQKKYNKERYNYIEDLEHFIHAEVNALMTVKNMDLSKAQIYVYHKGIDGTHKMARPCEGCMEAIKQRGIKTIHYSTPEGFATEYLNTINENNNSKKCKH